MSINKLDSRQC